VSQEKGRKIREKLLGTDCKKTETGKTDTGKSRTDDQEIPSRVESRERPHNQTGKKGRKGKRKYRCRYRQPRGKR